MGDKTIAQAWEELRQEPSRGVFKNLLETARARQAGRPAPVLDRVQKEQTDGKIVDFDDVLYALSQLQMQLQSLDPAIPSLPEDEQRLMAAKIVRTSGGRRKTSKFDRCVKSVRKTVKARKESAAIAICVTSVLHPKGRTIKRYRKGRLITQKRK